MKNTKSNSKFRGSREDKSRKYEDNGNRAKKSDAYDRRKGCHDNDPSWYAANPELLRDAASLSFPYSVGTEVPIAKEGTFSTLQWNAMAQPGMMTMDYTITPGVSNDATSAVNIAAINLYSYVRHANSGHTNYESADLMQYILSMDWIYTWYAELVRAYGVARTYSFKNKYMPKIYLEALGFDADDIISHLADFRYYINYLCVRLGALAVPSNFSYMARHIWMSSHIWADAPGNRFQAYAYRLGAYGVFTPYEDETGGKIAISKWSRPITYEDVISITNILLDPIMTNEDFGIMSGDILKAFGSNIVSLSPIAEDYTVVPEFNLEVLEQIHNTMIGVAQPTSIKQEGGILITEINCPINAPSAHGLFTAGSLKTYLDMFSEYPDPGAVMVSTRNMIALNRDINNDLKVAACGSEAITGAKIYVYNYEGGQLVTESFEVPYLNYIFVGASDNPAEMLTPALNIRALLEQFNYHPPVIEVLHYVERTGDATVECLGKSWDTTNLTEVSDVTLRKLHETAIMSQLNVPSMGAFALSR